MTRDAAIGKVRKLLALGQSPNQNEAAVALSMASEIMLKYKISQADTKEVEEEPVVVRYTGIRWTKTTGWWVPELADVVCQHFFCRTMQHHLYGQRSREVMIVGMQSDADACLSALRFAYDVAISYAKQIKNIYSCYSFEESREAVHAFCFGFSRGLASALRQKQESVEEEFGLVVSIPKQVDDEVASRSSGVVTWNREIGEENAPLVNYGFKKGAKLNLDNASSRRIS